LLCNYAVHGGGLDYQVVKCIKPAQTRSNIRLANYDHLTGVLRATVPQRDQNIRRIVPPTSQCVPAQIVREDGGSRGVVD